MIRYRDSDANSRSTSKRASRVVTPHTGRSDLSLEIGQSTPQLDVELGDPPTQDGGTAKVCGKKTEASVPERNIGPEPVQEGHVMPAPRTIRFPDEVKIHNRTEIPDERKDI